MLDDFVNIDRLDGQPLIGTEQPIHQVAQAIRFADDDTCVFGQFLIGQLLGQQLGGAAHSAQRILDFVRQAANHRAGGFLRVQHALFPANALQPVNRDQLQHEAVSLLPLDGGDNQVDLNFLAAVCGQQHTAACEGRPGAARVLQGFQ